MILQKPPLEIKAFDKYGRFTEPWRQFFNGLYRRMGVIEGDGYSHFEADGTLVFENDAIVYDDIQVFVSLGRVPAANAPTWTTWDFGLGGMAFPVLGFGLNDYLDLYVQTSHSMKLNTLLENHIHWTIPSDSATDKIKFQIEVISGAIGEDFAVPTGSPYSAEYTLDGTESAKHNYLDIGDIAAINSTVSSLYLIRLKRIAASASDYANDVYVLYSDCHYQKDTVGCRQGDTK